MRTIDAVRSSDATLDVGEFSYTVLIDPKPQSAPGERRDAPRRRTRLRSGKVVDGNDRFVTECLVRDLSATGMRLRLPAGLRLPSGFQVYDDQTGELRWAEMLWHRGDEVGIRFIAMEITPRNKLIAADMRRKYYMLPR